MVSREREEMATLNITIINGKFIDATGALVEIQTEDEICGNGWNVKRLPDGTIECVSKSRYLDGTHAIKYTIFPDGIDRISTWTPRDKKRILHKGRAFCDNGEPISGIICLSDGKIDQRFAYFRSFGFQKFLDDNNLSGVRFMEPNKRFTLIQMHNRDGYICSGIYTDGCMTRDYIRCRQNDKKNRGHFELIEGITISDASWTVVQIEKNSEKNLITNACSILENQ